jgi:hypothetical protein
MDGGRDRHSVELCVEIGDDAVTLTVTGELDIFQGARLSARYVAWSSATCPWT